jgi:hypothetical protein
MNAKLVLVKGCPRIDDDVKKLIAKYVQYCVQQLELNDTPIKIRLLGANPNEPITTGCYEPSTKTISSIAGGRHMIDYCRTIAHELAHMKQDVDGRITGKQEEIGGEIEDEANVLSGRYTKHFIKNILSDDEKKKLGLGSYK